MTKKHFKTILISTFIFLITVNSKAQNPTAEKYFKELSKAKDDSTRVQFLYKILYDTYSLSQQQRIDYSKKILDLSKKQDNKVMESIAMAEFGYLLAYNSMGSQGTELAFNALEIAQKHKSDLALGIVYNDLGVAIDDKNKSLKYILKGIKHSESAHDYLNVALSTANAGLLYQQLGKKDSAMYYCQKAYQLSLKQNIVIALPYCMNVLANVHFADNDSKIAYQYLLKASKLAYTNSDNDSFMLTNTNLAQYFLQERQTDSALYYTNKAAMRLKKGKLIDKLNVYHLYREIYRGFNKDSTLKYFDLVEKTKYKLDELSENEQNQLLTIKKEIEIEQANEQRHHNIQYGIIGTAILTFFIFFLMVSRTVIVNEKWISFLAILALLLVFEFINLLIHPFLGNLTHHSPFLMLLCMVIIASILIPLHHKLEHFISHKLTEKNKAIRLALAKKTLEELNDTEKVETE